MKKLLITAVTASALMLSGAASAQQQAEQDMSSFISEQIASVSSDLFNGTRAAITESLQSWSDELMLVIDDEVLAVNDTEASSTDDTSSSATTPESKQ